MRPDEHKKKKNAAYKKKHGITKSDGGDVTKKNDSKSKVSKGKGSAEALKSVDDSKVKPTSLSGARHDGARHHAKSKKENSSSDSSSSDLEEVERETMPKVKKTFQRRHIVSNWQKYAEPEADEKVTAKGENYEKLLSMAGEAISHFRFKDELEWEVHSSVGSDEGADSYSQLLCVDSAQLAQSLSCLPLYQIMGLSQNVFPADQLLSMTEVANENKTVYSTSNMSEGPTGRFITCNEINASIDSQCVSVKQAQKTEPQPCKISALKTKNQTPSSSESPSISKISDKALLKDKSHMEPTAVDTERTVKASFKDTDTGKDDHNKFPMASRKNLVLEDEDLETLLDADEPIKHLSDIGKTAPAPLTTVQSTTVKPSTDVPSSSTVNEAKKKAQESADLEDWLDSILDD